MKYLIAFLSVYMILTSCNNVKERTVYIDEIPIEECKMQSHSLPPVLIFPQSINSFQDKIIVLEPKRKDSIVSVFSSSDFNCIYSGLSKGHAKHELIDPRKDYFAKNDSSFYILDYNIEKEYKIDGQNQLKYLGYKAFSFPDILNKMVRVGSNKHISAGFTSGEGEEHLLWENGNYHGFGEYPTTSCRNEECFFYNGKHTAGVIGKDKIWDFYMYQDLIRSYDLDGNLLENIKIINRNKNTKKKSNQDYEVNFWGLQCNTSYIVTSYNEYFSKEEFYSQNDKKREIQLWTWDGYLKRRIHFNIPFGIYTISENNILYAMCTGQPHIIYSYDLNEK